jgi:uncharacterized damage-inducible protein DinB
MSTLAGDFMRQNNWANARMLDCCEGLDEAALDASLPGTYGKVRDTLVHMVSALGRYARRLEVVGFQHDERVHEDKPWPGFAVLKAASESAGRALEQAADGAPEGWQLRTSYDGRDWVMDAAVPIVQAMNHCTDHRSQISTILTQAGLTPPELDAWQWADAEGRTLPA